MVIKIRVADRAETVFKKNWRLCVGTGRLGLALQKEYMEHLIMVKQAIGFEYIRGHGLFHDDLAIYREIETDGQIKPFYNFTYIDRIFDSFLEAGIRPFIELGFMPRQLASGDQTIFDWKGHVTPPKDYEEWARLVRATVRHFIDRYGPEEVLTWPFEVWNEPNLVHFWKDADKAEYFKLYKTTAAAVKEAHPGLLVGGPAICGGSDEWIADFLDFCDREQAPVDFVSRHAYTSMQPHKVTAEYYYQELHDPSYMLEELEKVRGMIDRSPFPRLPFHITEYNTSYSPVNPVHDTVLNAAYLARILSEGGDFADSFSYWTFSDVFEELGVPRAPFHGGFGLVALHGIPKPTFHLFAFFRALGDEVLHRDERMIVTRRKDGSIALAAWNLVMDKGAGFELNMELEIPIRPGEWFVKRQTVDEDHGNPWRVWQQMGRPRFPAPDQIETLRQAARVRLRTERVFGCNGIWKAALTLGKNEVTLVEISPVEDQTDTYDGLDDSLITSYS